jgi:hypothetical protein
MSVVVLRRRGASIATIKGVVSYMTSGATLVRRDKIHRLEDVPEVLIRWNCRTNYPANFVINTPIMIERMNNKVLSRKLLMEAGVPVPVTFFSKEEARISISFPLIGRPTKHSQGENLVVNNHQFDLENDQTSTYWSVFIPKDREYRVYVFFGRVFGICEKKPVDPRAIAWNNSLDNGVFETIPWKHFPLDVAHLALRAAHALDIDLGLSILSLKEESITSWRSTAPPL